MNENTQIKVVIRKHVMHIGINRPHKKNALTDGMYDSMRLALTDAGNNPDVRVVLFHGTKEVFCAGNDLKGFDNRDPDNASPGVRFLSVLEAFSKPVVAAVSGIAVGIGVTLLMHCDLAYAAEDTRFRLPFINLGVCPEAGSSFLLPASAGFKKTAEVLMLGEFFDTATAVELGIVNQAVAAGNVLAHAEKKAQLLAQKPQQALLTIKQLLKHDIRQAVVDRMALEAKFFGELLLTQDSIDARTKLKNRIGKTKDT